MIMKMFTATCIGCNSAKKREFFLVLVLHGNALSSFPTIISIAALSIKPLGVSIVLSTFSLHTKCSA